MGLTVATSGGSYKQVPAGAHVARCIRVIDLGTQLENFQGDEKLTQQLMLFWELHGEDSDGQPLIADNGDPLIISQKYTKSLGAKAKLRGVLESWRGKPFTDAELKGFDVSKLLGAYCMVNVSHKVSGNGKTYANVTAVTPLPSALSKAKPAGVLPTLMLDLDHFDEEVFMALPQWLRDVINQSVERKSKPVEKKEEQRADYDDSELEDCPF